LKASAPRRNRPTPPETKIRPKFLNKNAFFC
jgi:hypothetical protein